MQLCFLTLFPYDYILSSNTTYPISKTVELATCCYLSFNLSKDILFVNFLNVPLNFVISLFLLIGQFSDDNTAAITVRKLAWASQER